MGNRVKNQKDILAKLKIEVLNPMQEEAKLAIHSGSEVVLLSPTGTGKTLAFLLPLIAELNPDIEGVQALIIVPSRELAIQIEQVTREMGAGFKTNAVYGGRMFSKEKAELKHSPSILIGTPGRVADHIRRESFTTASIKTLVLDEFDKSLEVGFNDEMIEILESLKGVKKKILTSATQKVEIPEFVGLDRPKVIDYLNEENLKLEIRVVISPSKDKLSTLAETLQYLNPQSSIVFCNFKDSISRVSEFLMRHNIPHGCFHGGMEQKERERTLIKFRNGTHRIIVATDLAARGLDVTEIKNIVHYHLPQRSHEFVHRNGRTARMHNEGTAFIIKWEGENLPEFIAQDLPIQDIQSSKEPVSSEWATVFVSGGRKDKISKGDIAGLFLKQGNLSKDEIGMIELKQDCAFVAVHRKKVEQLLKVVNNTKLKKKKVRVTVI